MNVEIGAEAVLFPEKEYINGIAVAVYQFGMLSIQILLSFTSHSPDLYCFSKYANQ